MDDGYSAQKLIEFLDFLISKGLMNKETANSRKVSSTKILEILDESEKSDLRTLDVDKVFNRFINIKGKDYNPLSLKVYKARFSSALNDFLSWKTNPVSFKPSGSTRTSRTKPSEVKERTNGNISRPVGSQSNESKLADAVNTPDHLSLPIPLRKGVIVKVLGLPNDLTPDEAKKIAAIVSAYAVVLE